MVLPEKQRWTSSLLTYILAGLSCHVVAAAMIRVKKKGVYKYIRNSNRKDKKQIYSKIKNKGLFRELWGVD